MLIDATHLEETRVAVVDGNRLIDYDYESKVRKQLKGSIFLAKVTRVEPSLQAAFVNFGGNRHGFLPFNEIHPDYFRIPIADREALIAEQQAEMEARRAEEEAEDEAEQQGESQPAAAVKEDEMPDAEEEPIMEVGGENAEGKPQESGPVAGPEEPEEPEEDMHGDEQPAFDEGETALDDSAEGPVQEQEFPDEEFHDEGDVNGNVREEGDSELSDDAGNNENDAEGGRGNRYRGRGGRGRGRGRGRGGGRGGGRGRGRGRHMEARSRRFVKRGDAGEDEAGRFPMRRRYKIQEVIKRGQIMLIQVSREERGNKGAAVTTYLSLPGRYCVLMPNSQRAGGVSRKVASFDDRRRMREMLSEMSVPDGMSVIMRTAGVARTKAEIKRDLDYLLKLWDGIRELTLKSTAPALVHEEGQLIRRSIRDIYTSEIDEIQIAGEEGFKTAKEYMKMMIPSHIKRVHHYDDEKMPLFNRYQVESQIADMGEPTVRLKSGGYLVINPTEALVSIDVNSGRATRERHIEETALKTNLEAAEELARQLRLRDLGGLIVVDFIDMEDRRNNRKVENRLRDALSSDRARIQIGRISSFGLLELSRQRLNPSLTEAMFERCPHCKGIGFVRTTDSAAILALRALEEEGGRGRAAEVALNVPDAVAIYILNNKRGALSDIERRYGFKVMIRADETLAPSSFRVDQLRSAPGVSSGDDDAAEGDENKPEAPASSGDGEESGGQRQQPQHHRHEGGDSGPDGDGRRRGGRRRRGRRGGRGRFRNRDDNNRDDNRHHQGRRDETGFAGDSGDDYAADGTYDAPPPAPAAAESTDDFSAEDDHQPASEPSNDRHPPAPRDYEVVNEPPGQKKKGWWNKISGK